MSFPLWAEKWAGAEGSLTAVSEHCVTSHLLDGSDVRSHFLTSGARIIRRY